jgi:hypothetical protein
MHQLPLANNLQQIGYRNYRIGILAQRFANRLGLPNPVAQFSGAPFFTELKKKKKKKAGKNLQNHNFSLFDFLKKQNKTH